MCLFFLFLFACKCSGIQVQDQEPVRPSLRVFARPRYILQALIDVHLYNVVSARSELPHASDGGARLAKHDERGHALSFDFAKQLCDHDLTRRAHKAVLAANTKPLDVGVLGVPDVGNPGAGLAERLVDVIARGRKSLVDKVCASPDLG